MRKLLKAPKSSKFAFDFPETVLILVTFCLIVTSLCIVCAVADENGESYQCFIKRDGERFERLFFFFW